jgi:phosphoribosylformylglycinamidine synthase
VRGIPPELDLEAERRLQELMVALGGDRLIRSAHDCSDGGVAITLAECCFGSGGAGAEASIEATVVAREPRINMAAAVFGESPSRVLVSAAPEHASKVMARAAAAGVPATIIGRTGGSAIRIFVGGELAVDVPVADLERLWSTAVEKTFVRKVA